MFAGTEDEARVLRLFTSPQGLEFCAKNNWPTLEQMRAFDKAKAEWTGVYIDAGNITLHNPRRAVLIGDTHASLLFDDWAEVKHNVVVVHGATAKIAATHWAVVFAEKNVGGGTIDYTKGNNAIVYV